MRKEKGFDVLIKNIVSNFPNDTGWNTLREKAREILNPKEKKSGWTFLEEFLGRKSSSLDCRTIIKGDDPLTIATLIGSLSYGYNSLFDAESPLSLLEGSKRFCNPITDGSIHPDMPFTVEPEDKTLYYAENGILYSFWYESDDGVNCPIFMLSGKFVDQTKPTLTQNQFLEKAKSTNKKVVLDFINVKTSGSCDD